MDVQLVVGTNDKMVPMLDAALSNAINGVGSDNGACVDSVGNLSCQVYKITLSNNGSRLTNLTGTVELYPKEGTSNVYTNLKWRELTNLTTIEEGAMINGMNRSILVSNLTIESKEVRTWYIAVWISELNSDQIDMNKGKFGGTVTFEVVEPNTPNLDSGNLIPVYYDDTEEVWRKADSSNARNSWYNYRKQKWANAVLISDSTKRNTYRNASVDTPIIDSDITAFYVWIPRYKYRVWNITRQGGDESTYAYEAYTKGIDIEWESGISSTGNVECAYNIANSNPDITLSDTCTYNGTTTITPTSGNANFTNAWYTHPAFTFGGEEKTGFWIGKFETTGTLTLPTILPDVTSLREQNVSTQFTTSRKFQNYGLSSNVDAHMLTNLEWGAVAYLTHSKYGLCNGTSCRDVYINNSGEYYTGRSGGALSGSTDLNLLNVYPNDTTETTKYNINGYYTYKGYFIDYDGNITTKKDITKVASTTGNITGVYDLSGGAYEYVMGNMVNSSNVFYPSSSGTNWNGSSILQSKYYNSYSYGTSYSDQMAFNRARLGDGTAEVISSIFDDFSEYLTWSPGKGIRESRSTFVYDVNSRSWFWRGGVSFSGTPSSFYFNAIAGGGDETSSFRSSLV